MHLDNLEAYSAEYGIVTFSLGVLQSSIVDFEPELPSWKRNAILLFDFVDYTPIYVKWPTNFWGSYTEFSNITEFILLNDGRFSFFTWIMNLDHPKYYDGSLLWRFDIAIDLAVLVQFQSVEDTIKMIIDLKLRHYFPESHIPEPDEVFVSSWTSNPYIQGAWSNYPPGST